MLQLVISRNADPEKLRGVLPWLETWQPAVEFLAGAHSLHTRAAYTTALRQFVSGAAVPLAEVVTRHVLAFKVHLVDRGLAPRTIRQRLLILSAFFGWAIEGGFHPGPNPVARVPLPRVGRDPAGISLTPAQLDEFFAIARNARDRAILRLLAEGGLRASELVALQQRDVVLEHGELGQVTAARLRVRRGKGGGARTVDLPPGATAALVQYLPHDSRLAGPSRPLFQHLYAAGRGIGYHTVYRIVTDCAARAGLGHVAPHDLRRTYATLALDLGQAAPRVARQMGHRSMAQTVRYYRERG